MSDLCHVCGPVKHEAPTVICAPCALDHGRLFAQQFAQFVQRLRADFGPTIKIEWVKP